MIFVLYDNASYSTYLIPFLKLSFIMNTTTTPAPAALFRPAQPFPRPLRRSPHPTPTPSQPGSRRARLALVAAPKSSVAHGRSDRCYTIATPARHRCAADFFPRLPATHNQHHSVSAAHRAHAAARTPPRSRPQLQRRSIQPWPRPIMLALLLSIIALLDHELC